VNAVVVSMALFAIGLYGVLTRRDLVAVLASVEVLAGAPLLLLVRFGLGTSQAGVEAVGLLIIVVAAAEAAVGLGLVVAVARRMGTTRTDDLTEVRG
jgi:NADH-quinone oxidoreductase subunit K